MAEVSVLRVIPIHSAPDLINFRQLTHPVVLVDAVLGDRHSLPFQEVLDALMFWANGALLPRGSDEHARELLAGMHVWLALADPETPFGAATDVGLVYFRGAWFDRDERGVLTHASGSAGHPWAEVSAALHGAIVNAMEAYKP
jgi:hypothetical protein